MPAETNYYNLLIFMGNLVGTARFELATTCPPGRYATRLRYAPIVYGAKRIYPNESTK